MSFKVRGIFSEDPIRKFGAETYFRADIDHEEGGPTFQGICRDFYGQSLIQGLIVIDSMIFTKIYRGRNDVLLYLLKPLASPGIQWAGAWAYACELDIDWLDQWHITDAAKAQADVPRLLTSIAQCSPIGGRATMKVE